MHIANAIATKWEPDAGSWRLSRTNRSSPSSNLSLMVVLADADGRLTVAGGGEGGTAPLGAAPGIDRRLRLARRAGCLDPASGIERRT